MLYQGRVRWEGSIDEIKTTTDPVVREFVEGRPTEDDGGVPGGVVART
jgi:ABC-type transporter Mla maintaining outer membrane lipid asymmetry ATPase subunit MlaF